MRSRDQRSRSARRSERGRSSSNSSRSRPSPSPGWPMWAASAGIVAPEPVLLRIVRGDAVLGLLAGVLARVAQRCLVVADAGSLVRVVGHRAAPARRVDDEERDESGDQQDDDDRGDDVRHAQLRYPWLSASKRRLEGRVWALPAAVKDHPRSSPTEGDDMAGKLEGKTIAFLATRWRGAGGADRALAGGSRRRRDAGAGLARGGHDPGVQPPRQGRHVRGRPHRRGRRRRAL